MLVFTRLIVAVLIGCSSFAFGYLSYEISDFDDPQFTSDLDFISVEDGRTFVKAAHHPTFKWSHFEVGLDVNLYLPLDGDFDDYPSNLNFLALRHLAFDYHKKHGLKWGILTDVTFGQGLLMNRFSTRRQEDTEFTTDQGGVLGYTTLGPIGVKGMWTASDVVAGRLTYKTAPILLGAPLEIGATYAEALEAVNEELDNGTSITRPKAQGYGVDIALPLAGDFFKVFGEYTALESGGSDSKGVKAGIKGDFLSIFEYGADYRVFSSGFIPGYFNSTYTSTSVDFGTDGADKETKGYAAYAAAQLFKGYMKAGAQFEKYDDRDALLSGSIGWKPILNIAGVLNYTQPFAGGSNNAVATLDLLYRRAGLFDYVVQVRRVYTDNDSYSETWKAGLRFKI